MVMSDLEVELGEKTKDSCHVKCAGEVACEL